MWRCYFHLWWYFSYTCLCICATICCYSPQTQHSKWWLWVGGHKVAFVEVFVVCVSVSSCVFVFLCVCVSICALICYHRPQTGGWEWDDGQTAGTRCRVSGNRHSSPPAAALIYALLSYPVWIYDISNYAYICTALLSNMNIWYMHLYIYRVSQKMLHNDLVLITATAAWLYCSSVFLWCCQE